MKKSETTYRKIASFYTSIGKKLSSIIPYDTMLFASKWHSTDRTIIIPMEKNTESFFLEEIDQKSLLYTVSTSGHPNIVNHIEDSFIFDQKSDNPLNYSAKSIALLPCSFAGNTHTFGVIILYQFNDKQRYFQKETLATAHRWLLDELSKNQKVLTKLLIDAQINPIETEAAPQSEDEVQKASQFFSSVIHDIRTPMNAVMGFLELLSEEADPKQREYITAAHRSSEMVVALINDVLDINKLSMGKLDINKYFFSFMDEVENTALLFYHSALKKELDFIFYFDPKIPYVIKSDPFRLKQILNNLLSNAIKFTPKGGYIVMEFTYEEANDTLIIRIEDSGIGISANAQKSIFQPFTQESSNTSSKYGGTGLGLSISKQLVELLGGGLFLKSEKDKGAHFSVAIPCNTVGGIPTSLTVTNKTIPTIYLIDGPESKQRHIKYFAKYFKRLNLPHYIVTIQEALKNTDDEAIYLGIKMDYKDTAFKKLLKHMGHRLIILEAELFSDSKNIPREIPILKMPVFPKKLFSTITSLHQGQSKEEGSKDYIEKPKHILIVDDSLINLKLTQEVIQRFGFTSMVAKNGQEAIDIYAQSEKPFDVIIIDKNMPVVNGSEAIRQIRSLPGGDHPSIYGLTGDFDENTASEMLDAGADEILHKPIKIDKIREIVRR